MFHALKNFFHPMQNQDPTLYEKSWGAFRFGRYYALVVFAVGSILAWALSIWFSNVLQDLIVGLCSRSFGIFSGHGFDYTLQFFGATLFTPKAFLTNENTIGTITLLSHFGFIATIFHFIAWGLLEWFITYYAYTIFTKTRNLNHGEYGKARIATPKEIRKETYKIPDRTYPYPYHSGFPVMHTFNWRGRLNKWVKTEMPKTQSFLRLSDDELVKMFEFVGIVISLFAFFIISGSVDGSVHAHTGNTEAIPWYSPYHEVHWCIAILRFFIHSCFRLLITLGKLQYKVWGQPWYSIGLFYLVELIALMWIWVHMSNIKKAFDNGWIKALFTNAFVRNKTVTDSNGHRKNVSTFIANFKKHFAHKETQMKSIANNNQANAVNDKLRGEAAGEKRTKQIAERKAKTAATHTAKAIHVFFEHPLLSFRLGGLEIIDLLVPLEKGITGWYYISPRPHNVLIYGTSGSGKGQMVVNPQMDINSRATPQTKPNMIVTDPKGESAAGAYAMLKRRGYDVKVMNILDLSHSMSFNPLRLVIKHTELGAVGTAAQDCSNLSSSIYNTGNESQNAYFYKSAASLFDAITFALLALAHSRYYGLNNLVTYTSPDNKKHNVYEDGTYDERYKRSSMLGKDNTQQQNKVCLGNDGHYHSEVNAYDKVTVHNVLEMTSQLGGENGQKEGEQEPVKKLFIYFDQLNQELSDLRKTPKRDMDDIHKDQLTILDQAIQKFQQTKMAGGKTAGSIFSTFMERLRIYQQPDVARMTSMDNFNPAEMGFDRLLTVQFNRCFRLQNIDARSWAAMPYYHTAQGYYTADVNGQGPLEQNKSHLSEIGMADIPFQNPIPSNIFYVTIDLYDERVGHTFRFMLRCTKQYYTAQSVKEKRRNYRLAPMVADIKLRQADMNGNKPLTDKYGRIIVHRMHDGYPTKTLAIDMYTHKEVLQKVAISMAQMPSSQEYNTPKIRHSQLGFLAERPAKAWIKAQTNFLYNPHPTAWFVVAPQNKRELNTLGTFAISQTFNILSGISMQFTNSRHIQRPLQMILDELGNLPAIAHLDSIASFGRSQHIYIMPIFQDKEQCDNIYKQDTTKIIFANCPTVVYILSSSPDTIKEISAGFEKRTITSTSLSHNPTKATSVDYNSNPMAQNVMPTAKLRNLKVGEEAILRTTDRSSNTGKDVEPLPIFNTKNHIMPYSWWFLGGSFSHGSLGAVPIVTPHKYLDLESRTLQFENIYAWMDENNPIDLDEFPSRSDKIGSLVDNSGLGNDFINDFSVYIQKANNLYSTKDKKNIKKAYELIKHIPGVIRQFSVLKGTKTALQAGAYILYELHKQNGLNALVKTQTDTKADGVAAILRIIQEYIQGDTQLDRWNWLSRLLTTESEDNGTRFFKTHLRNLNHLFNEYLSDAGFLTPKKDNYQLTPMSKKILAHPQIVSNMVKNCGLRNISTSKPLSSFLVDLIQCLNIPQQYREYVGLAFGFKLFSKKSKDIFSTNKKDPSKSVKMPWGLYRNIMLCALDRIVVTGKTQNLTPSKYYYSLINGLDTEDVKMNKDQKETSQK